VGAAGDRQHDAGHEALPGQEQHLDMLVEMAYRVLWYRALISHEPLDAATARRLAGSLLSAGR
jgi:hypothetical protein